MILPAHSVDLRADAMAAMKRCGVEVAEPSQLRMDGVICRFSTSDRDLGLHRRNGWAVVFTDGPRAVVTCGDLAKSITETIPLGGNTTLDAAERERQRISIEQAKAAHAAEMRNRHARAAIDANKQWSAAAPAPALHPYLVGKGIDPAGVRERFGFLLIPLRDDTGKIHNLQRIRVDGQKRFLSGGRVKGLYASIGRAGQHLLICEGWATGKTLHATTGLPIVVAFSAGNLVDVTKVIRAKYPAARITLCADNDAKPDGSNPGVKAATDAAAAFGGYLAIPPIPGDFNDYHAARSGNPELTEVIASARIDK